MDLGETKNKIIEKLGKSFEEVKSFAGLDSLNLTDDEIVQHFDDIAQFIKSVECCGTNPEECGHFGQHYDISRNCDGVILLRPRKCLKRCKRVEGLTTDILRKYVDKYVSGDLGPLEKINVLKGLKAIKLKDSPKLLATREGRKLKHINKNLGNPLDEIGNCFLVSQSLRDALVAFFATYYAIREEPVLIVPADELKRVLVLHAYAQNARDDLHASEQLKKFINVKNLIITNIGLETNGHKKDFYLSFLPDFLRKRIRDKRTHIITPEPGNYLMPGEVQPGQKAKEKELTDFLASYFEK